MMGKTMKYLVLFTSSTILEISGGMMEIVYCDSYSTIVFCWNVLKISGGMQMTVYCDSHCTLVFSTSSTILQVTGEMK